MPEVAAAPAHEDAGFGALRTARGLLPLRAMDVEARVAGLVAHVALAQTFVNVHAEPIEATYIFPLPERAAVTQFRFEVAGRVVVGALRERGEAREAYDAAIAAGQRAAITEEERPGVFTIRVGNLLPGEAATVRLTMVGPLAWDGDEATFRFPLVVAPRYVPGIPLSDSPAGEGISPDTDAAPDASRISPPVLLPGFPNPVRLSLTVHVAGDAAVLAGLRASLHSVASEPEEGACLVRLLPGERLDRDFILRFPLAGEGVAPSLVLAPDSEGEDGTYLLTLVPPRGARASERGRDVVFVVDRSGSMGGWKMVGARRAVARMVDTLDARDRFALFAFDHDIATPPGLPADAFAAADDRARFRAVEYLAGLEANGGTELLAPLERAAALFGPEDATRERILVLATDAQIANEDQVIHALARQLRGVRVVALGVDTAVNAGFLTRITEGTRGMWALVESEDRLDAAMDRVRRMIAPPILRDVALAAAPGLALVPDTQAPERAPELVAGAPLLVSGRYRRNASAAELALTVTAHDTAGAPWQTRVVARAAQREEAAAIGATWARAQVRTLEDRYTTTQNGTLPARIVATSLRHGVLSRFTAFVAIDERVVTEGGEPVHIVQPVEQPHGWDLASFDGVAAGVVHHLASPAAAYAVRAPQAVLGAAKGLLRGMASGGAPPPAPPPASAPRKMKPVAPTPQRSRESASRESAASALPLERRIADLVTRLDVLDASSSTFDTLACLTEGRDLCIALLAETPPAAPRDVLDALRTDLVTFLASPAGALTPAEIKAQLAALRTRLLDALRPLLPEPARPFWKRLPFGR